MTISLSRAKSICTKAELALARSSRNPILRSLSAAQLKQRAQRARKLFDKWQDLSRRQARARSGQLVHADTAARSQLKMRLFRSALDNFEKRLAALEAKGKAAGAAPRTGPSHRKRARSHRAERAAVRAELAAAQAEHLARARAGGKGVGRTTRPGTPVATKPGPTGKPVAPEKPPTPPPTRPTKTAPTPRKRSKRRKAFAPAPEKQPLTGRSKGRAAAAAKQARLARSGLTTRVRGHISARGKRAQARRDRNN